MGFYFAIFSILAKCLTYVTFRNKNIISEEQSILMTTEKIVSLSATDSGDTPHTVVGGSHFCVCSVGVRGHLISSMSNSHHLIQNTISIPCFPGKDC